MRARLGLVLLTWSLASCDHPGIHDPFFFAVDGGVHGWWSATPTGSLLAERLTTSLFTASERCSPGAEDARAQPPADVEDLLAELVETLALVIERVRLMEAGHGEAHAPPAGAARGQPPSGWGRSG